MRSGPGASPSGTAPLHAGTPPPGTSRKTEELWSSACHSVCSEESAKQSLPKCQRTEPRGRRNPSTESAQSDSPSASLSGSEAVESLVCLLQVPRPPLPSSTGPVLCPGGRRGRTWPCFPDMNQQHGPALEGDQVRDPQPSRCSVRQPGALTVAGDTGEQPGSSTQLYERGCAGVPSPPRARLSVWVGGCPSSRTRSRTPAAWGRAASPPQCPPR